MVCMTGIQYPKCKLEHISETNASNAAAILCLPTGRFGCKTEDDDDETLYKYQNYFMTAD
jgi:hypothetical protein